MTRDIVMIGPIRTGKSTLADLVAKRLKLPLCQLDALRFQYFGEIGYQESIQKKLAAEEGFLAVYRYWKPYEAHAVERGLAEHSGCVFDFGGGHSVYEDDVLFDRVQRALGPYSNVILILPSPDLDESVEILRARSIAADDWDGCDHGFDFHRHFVKHHSNHDLAKHVVYTKGKTPQKSADEILNFI